MRNLAAGFALGYLMIAFVITPTMLWAMQMTPSYAGGVVMVLDRSGIPTPIKTQIEHAMQARDRMLNEVASSLANKMFPQDSD